MSWAEVVWMYFDPRWLIVILGSAISFSVLSPIIYARKLNFFASTLPHSSLLAVTIGYMLGFLTGTHPVLWAVPVSIVLSLFLVAIIHRGVSEDSATSVFVGFSVSASVAAMYYILTNFPAQTSLWSYILGDPLLVSWEDTLLTLAVCILIILTVLPIYMKEIVIGQDRDAAQVLGINVKLHDYLVILTLTVASVTMLKTVGFVIEHVAFLMPAVIAAGIAKDAKMFLVYSVLVSAFAGILSLLLSIWLNLAPSAVYGLLLVGIYSILLMRRGSG
jgi:zinc/manganese transport system permease protein